MVPASLRSSKEDVVVIQWAQRDLTKAYGEGPSFSNYSLQANDYTERGLTTEYFKNLINNYLDCELVIGQVTVGLETGIESVKSFSEYKKQLEFLSTLSNVKKVKMSEFALEFKKLFVENPDFMVVSDGISSWEMTPYFRKNEQLGDYVSYENSKAFSDYFIRDDLTFLNRKLPQVEDEKISFPPFFVFTIMLLLFTLFSFYLRVSRLFLRISVFVFVSFFCFLKAFPSLGGMFFMGLCQQIYHSFRF